MFDNSTFTNHDQLTRQEAAAELRISVSSVDLLILRQLVKTVRKGHKLFITREEVLRLKARSLPSIWPPKQNGKTTRHFAPVNKKPPAKTSLSPPVEGMAVNE